MIWIELMRASELWQGEQICRENETGISMTDEVFYDHVVAVYHRYLTFNERIVPDMVAIVSGKYPKEYSCMPDAHDVLSELKHRGVCNGRGQQQRQSHPRYPIQSQPHTLLSKYRLVR